MLCVIDDVNRIPRSSAAQLVNKTVPIPNDPGYYAVALNVFHQLHCLVSNVPSDHLRLVARIITSLIPFVSNALEHAA